MRKLLFLTAAALCLPSLASAQLLCAPDSMFITNAGSSGLTWRSTAFHFQMIYDTTHFTNQGVVGPISIDRMRFRPSLGVINAGGQQYLGDGATFGVNISIGTSANDYLTPSTTFALNRGTMQTVMTNGTVNVGPSTGSTPNEYVIDIVVPGGFVYDPTLGADLLVEVDAPAPSAAMPAMACGSVQTTHRSVRISNSTQAATTGSTSGFASVILFDISGGPGGVSQILPGLAQNYGNGCYPNQSRTFAEVFPIAAAALDLGGGITMTPDVAGAPTSYTVSAGAGAFVAPTNGPVLSNSAGAMGDDTMSGPMDFSGTFTFPFVGGSTGVVHANSNGYLVLAPSATTGGDFSPSLTDLVGSTADTDSGTPRLAPAWYDLHASRNTTVNPAAGLYFDVDTVNNKALITWLDVGEFATAAAGGASFNFQVELSADGTIEYRYGAMSPFTSASQPKIVGFTPGAPTLEPPSQDFSAAMPFASHATEIASSPLSLSAAPAPVLGGISTITTGNVPVAPGAMINVISLGQIAAGLDLGFIGMPGCNAYVDPTGAMVIQTQFLLGSGSVAYGLTIPNDPFLANLQVYLQSLAFDSSPPNAFGAIASNGVALTLGTVQ